MALPTKTNTLDLLYLATWQIRRKKITDNIFNATPFWYMMTSKNRRRSEDGGKWIEEPLMYGKNSSVTSFGKGDTFAIQETDFVTAAIFNWKYVGGSIVRYWVDEQKNKGKNKVIDIITTAYDNLEISMIDALETQLFSDGTGNGGKDINGLANLVADLPTTGIVGGLNRATYTWWRNQYNSMSGIDVGVYLRPRMVTKFNDCGQQGNGITRFPNMIVCAQDVYEAYESEMTEMRQVTSNAVGDLGFGDLVFKGQPMTWSPACGDGRLYMLNTNFITWVYDPDADFDMTEWKPVPTQYKDKVAQVALAGNLTINNAKKHCVIHSISP